MAYRDDLGAAKQRIVDLESDLENKKREATRLEETLSSTAAELNQLRHQVGGAPGKRRGQLKRATNARFIVIGALALVSLGLAGALLYVRLAHDANEARWELKQAHLEVSRLEGQIARLQREPERSNPERSNPERWNPERWNPKRSSPFFYPPSTKPATTPHGLHTEVRYEVAKHKRALLARLRDGAASEGDAHMLEAICMEDGDRGCRNQAASYLQDLSLASGSRHVLVASIRQK
jgi:hypothetical protein